MNQSQKLAMPGASVLTLGTLVGGTLAPGQASAHAAMREGISYSTQTTWGDNIMSSHMTLHAMLDAPLREHAVIGVEALKAALLKTPDAEALQDAIEDNTLTIAEAVETGYPGTHDEFLALWRSHISYYKDYLQATMQDDEAGKEEVKDNLSQFAEELSNLLSDASLQLDPDELKESLDIHADQVTTIIDDLTDEEYEDVYATAHEAYEHMGSMAELLARCANKQSYV